MPALKAYGHDLTEMCREGKMDPVIGRKEEVERLILILCRRRKNNPVLVGEAGVGKTAIVEGLAQAIVKGDAKVKAISAASILAKVTRDRIMRAEAEHFPGYDFEFNKGYPCPVHKAALTGYGPSAIHRRTWVFMDNYVPWSAIRRTPPAGQSSLF